MIARFRGNALASMGVLQENLDREAVIHGLTPPACGRRVLVDVDASLLMALRELSPVRQGARVIGRHAVKSFAVWPDEAQGAVIKNLYRHSTLMNLSVMKAAELNKVGQLRLAAL